MSVKILRLVALCGVAAGLLGQGESEPYFALSSSRTFGTQEKPSVMLSAWNVDTLEFRVYRVEDPVKFFEQLDDPHEFGGRVPQPPRDRTLLERFHRWKSGLRANIRRNLRAQFSESPSAKVESMLSHPAAAPVNTGKATSGSKGTQYAETPVLNSQQLVLTFLHPITTRQRWQQETVEVPVKDKGVYLVEAVRKDLRAYTLLMVSDVAMISKNGREKIVNVVMDRNTGAPLAGVPVMAVTKNGDSQRAETNAEGIVEFPAAGISSANDVRILAVRGKDVAVNSPPGYALGLEADQWTGYIYTDRPVYRPGHTVHFKGVMRLRTANGYQVPAGKPVNVEIQDADQKPVYQKTLTASANGTIHDDLELPVSASLGFYFLQVKAGEAFMSGNFEVQDYKKPEYEVHVTAAQPRVLEGETIHATIDSRYYFGEPVSGAKVKYAVYRERYWFPLFYDPEDELATAPSDDDSADANDDSGDQVGDKDGQLDVDGKLNITIPTTVSDHKFDYRYRIEARIADAANREITGIGHAVATYGSFVLNVQPERYFYAPGGTGVFKIDARDYDNHPVRGRVHVELDRWDVQQQERAQVQGSTDVDLNADGSATATLPIPAVGGRYEIRATAHSVQNREVEDTANVWVSGGVWESADSTQPTVQIVADKKSYRAGETARLLISAGRAGTDVYISVEGADLRQFKRIHAQDSTVAFDIPVTANDEPGINVSATYIRNGVLHNGSKYIHVPPLEHQLNVKLSTDKPQYLPGQTADYSLEVSGADGKPVPRAEFSVGVVDEAIYGIRPDTTQNILSFFFDHDYNRVFTGNSLEYFFTGEAGKRRMRLAELRAPSHLAQLKPERLALPKVRRVFPDTAFWVADVTTDEAGRAHAKVEFPDSLTTWRATARGVTAETKVGGATLKTIVRKNVIVRLAAPRFFVQGDEVVISALVHNYLAAAKTAHVSLDLKGLQVLEGTTKDVQVPSRGEVKVDWKVRVQQVRSATLTAKALTDEESDALEQEIPVNIPGLKVSQSRGGSVSAGAAAGFDLAFPAKVQPGSRSLTIRVSPSVAGSLFDALDYLTSFPYGCVEQTMSSFLPDIVVQGAVRDLGLKVNLDDVALQRKIRAGLDILAGFQHQDGGWGWWETDDSHPFMTAYVVAGLVQAQDAGVKVNFDAIQRGAMWLKNDLTADPKLASDLRAYMVYALVLAGQAAPADLTTIYGARTNMSPYGLALLGLALERAKDGRASEIAATLEARAEQDQEQAWWTATRDPMLDFSIDATPEATAYVVKFLSHQRASSPLLPKAALWLMNHRNEGYWWSSTKQTAMVIYGLTDYLKATNELNPNLTATVFVNDKQVLTRKMDSATALNQADFTLDESALAAGVNHVRVTSSGAGRLYYSVRAEHYSTEDRLQKTGTVSLNLLRDYFRLVPQRNGEKIVYDTVPLNGPVAPGDVIAVRLTATGSEWKYVMIEDPIPAGTEFIERDNIYEIRNRPPWWQYSFTRRELHDDHLAIFQTEFAQGQQQYFYLLKVVNPGTFQVGPARVGPMYQSDVSATTESRTLEVK